MQKEVISGFWMGGPLTNIQKLSIQSFIDHGHYYSLFTYGDVDNAPEKCDLLDASSIVPKSDRERFQNDANFSDWFRTNFLLKFGGWYCDTDIVALKPFDFDSRCVFVSEYQFGGDNPENTTPLVNGCIVKVGAGDVLVSAIKSRIEQLDTKKCGYCDVGPNQFRWGVRQFNYTGYVQRPDIFDGLWPTDLNRFVSDSDWQPRTGAYALHLRTSYWKAGSKLDPNKTYDAASWFEYLKRRHGIGN